MVKPKVSVIIPTFNRLYDLAELAEALSRQTFQDFEVIIVNDGGTRVDVVKEFYPDIKTTIIHLEQNLHHVHARNCGIMSAKGKYIMLIDDDDLIVPSHMERMLLELQGSDFVYSDVEIVHYEVADRVRMPVRRTLFAYESDLPSMRRFSTFVPSGCLYRKEIHEEIGLFDVEVHNYWDWDFFLRVSEKYRVKRVAAAGVLYDFSDATPNQSKNLEARKKYLNRLSEKHGLGYLPTTNFYLLLEEPEVKRRKAESEIVWDGKPFVSRLAVKRSLEKLGIRQVFRRMP